MFNAKVGFTMSHMENPTIFVRFLDKFLKGLVPNFSEKVLDLLLVVGTLVYQGQHGSLSSRAWEDNAWEVATPWIWLVCLLAAYHVIKAARSLNRDIRQEMSQTKEQFIFLTDGEQIRDTRNHTYKVGVIACAFMIILLIPAYLGWRLTRINRDSGMFTVDESISFVNMS